MNSKMCVTLSWLIISLFMILTDVATAQTSPAPLPPAAREAFDEGMAAAGQQQWTIAIRSFLKAQKAAPEAPEVLFNLGLAESKVPGRELRAMAWFQAYLLAAPSAPNADAVRKEIVNLRIRVQATIEKMITQAKQMISQHMKQVWEKDRWISRVAVVQAKAGDVGEAKQTVINFLISLSRTHDWDFGGPPAALSEIAFFQYLTGDHDGTIETIRAIKPYGKTDEAHVKHYATLASRAYNNIARLQKISIKRVSMSGTYGDDGSMESIGNFHEIMALPEPTTAGVIYFINGYLSGLLFTDPQSALQAIEAKPMPFISGVTMQDQTMKGFVQAISQIADRLIDLNNFNK